MGETIKCVRLVVEGEVIRVAGPRRPALTSSTCVGEKEEEEDGNQRASPREELDVTHSEHQRGAAEGSSIWCENAGEERKHSPVIEVIK